MPLSLTVHRDGGKSTIVVGGDLDLTTADELVRAVAAEAPTEVTFIEVDLAAVPFIDSAGINALLTGRRAADEHGRAYRVTGATGLVRQVLEITGVWEHLSRPRV